MPPACQWFFAARKIIQLMPRDCSHLRLECLPNYLLWHLMAHGCGTLGAGEGALGMAVL